MSSSWDIGPLRATIADILRAREAGEDFWLPSAGLDPRSQALAWALVACVKSQALKERIANASSSDELLATLCLPVLLQAAKAGVGLRKEIDALCAKPVAEQSAQSIIETILQAVREGREKR